MSPQQLTALETKVRGALKPGTTMIYPGKSLRWAAAKMGLNIDQMETLEAGLMGLPKSDLDSPGLYALGEKIGAEVRQ